MALLFCDGFDHYAVADILKKWSGSNTSPANFNPLRTGRISGSALDTSSYKLWKNFDTGQTTIIFGAGVRGGSSSAYQYFWLTDYIRDHILIDLNYNSGVISAGRATSNAYQSVALDYCSVLGASSPVLRATEWSYLEVKVVCHETTGSVLVKLNGLTVIDVSNVDTIYSSSTGSKIYEQLCYHGGTAWLDDVYICNASGGVNDSFLGDVRVKTIFPDGAGATTQWDPSAGSNYDCVNDATANADTDYVSTSVTNEIDTYTFGAVTSNSTIKAVQTCITAKKTDVGTCTIAPVVRPASTDRVGTTQYLSTDYRTFLQCYDVNPEDSAAWEEADVNGCEFGMKKIA